MKRLSVIVLAFVLFLTALTGCGGKFQGAAASNATPTPASTVQPAADTWKAELYFSDNDAMYIVKEEREMRSDKKLDKTEKAKIAVEELIKGAKNKDLSTTIPAKTKVRALSIDQDTVVLDLSKEFVSDNVGGSAGETMAIAPIVLTLCSLEGIKQVSFKIEGKVQPDFKGHMTLDQPFKRTDFEQYLKK